MLIFLEDKSGEEKPAPPKALVKAMKMKALKRQLVNAYKKRQLGK